MPHSIFLQMYSLTLTHVLKFSRIQYELSLIVKRGVHIKYLQLGLILSYSLNGIRVKFISKLEELSSAGIVNV